MGSSYKQGKKGLPPFIQLLCWVCDTPAWQSLKPGPRALYVELKRKFNGHNNGSIYLSHRNAATALNVGRDTVSGYFLELEGKGFIVKTMGHCLGPSGLGQSAKWVLTELPADSAKATMEFKAWEKQKPRRKIQHSLAGKSNTPCRENQPMEVQRLENPATFTPKRPVTVSENPAIYTSSHIPTVSAAASRLAIGVGLCGLAEVAA